MSVSCCGNGLEGPQSSSVHIPPEPQPDRRHRRLDAGNLLSSLHARARPDRNVVFRVVPTPEAERIRRHAVVVEVVVVLPLTTRPRSAR